jgi:predicted dehydrogenase
MRYLVAGLGSIGRRHLRNLRALGETDIVLLRSGKSTLPEDELAGLPVETDLQVALQSRPDAVIVATPTALHLDVAIPAARTGCAILLEKPVSNSMQRIDELEAAVEEARASVVVGFQFRFHPLLQYARTLLTTGALGRVLSAQVQYGEYLPSWHPWEDYRKGYAARADLGGGVVLTQCHALDYLRWLIGPVTAVSAFTGRLGGLDIDVEDTAAISCRFGQGALASVHLDYTRRPPTHRLEIAGTKAVFSADLLQGTTKSSPMDDSRPTEVSIPSGWERNKMYLDLMRHFVDVVNGRAEPACSLAEGITVQRMIAGILESDSTGRAITVGA